MVQNSPRNRTTSPATSALLANQRKNGAPVSTRWYASIVSTRGSNVGGNWAASGLVFSDVVIDHRNGTNMMMATSTRAM